MSVCIETVGKYPADGQLTPTFISERLCSIIFPEEADTGEFFLTWKKILNRRSSYKAGCWVILIQARILDLVL